MQIQAIALDIDGTLTNDEKVITPRTRKALLDAQKAGIKLVLASGRPVQGLRRLARELELDEHHGLLVSYNGAHVVDASSGQVVFDQPLSPDAARAVLEHMRSFDVIPWITEGEYLYIEDVYRCDIKHRGRTVNIVKYERDACDLRIREVPSLLELCDRPQDKILVAADDTYLQEHWREMAAPFADSVSCMFTADFYFEFMARDVHKGRALSQALPSLGIDLANVVAFGDAQNDLTMLQSVGMGVAMGNATEEVIAAADCVTATNNEDGIALALERLLG